MSFARVGEESDVYVYVSVWGKYVCEGCTEKDTAAEMIAHLEGHRTDRTCVPQRMIDQVRDEAERWDPEMARIRAERS